MDEQYQNNLLGCSFDSTSFFPSSFDSTALGSTDTFSVLADIDLYHADTPDTMPLLGEPMNLTARTPVPADNAQVWSDVSTDTDVQM